MFRPSPHVSVIAFLVGPREAGGFQWLPSVRNLQEALWVSFPAQQQSLAPSRHALASAMRESVPGRYLKNRLRKSRHKALSEHETLPNDSGDMTSCGPSKIARCALANARASWSAALLRRFPAGLRLKSVTGAGVARHVTARITVSDHGPHLTPALPY